MRASGAAIVSGEPDKSLLIRAVNHADTLAMPPKEKLSQRDINDLIAWVKNGAVWPEGDKPKVATKKPAAKADAKPMPFTNEQLLDESRARVADYVRAAAREISLEKTSRSFGAEFDKRADKAVPPSAGVQVIEAENYQRGSAMDGTLLPTPNRGYVTGTANFFPQIYNSNRRSVYLPVVRSALYEVYQVFDFAEPSVLNGKRDSTTIATQALFMLNSQLVADQAGDVASGLLAADSDDAARVRRVFQITLQREPLSSEIARSLDFVRRFEEAAETGTSAERRLAAWKGFCRTQLASSEFLFVE